MAEPRRPRRIALGTLVNEFTGPALPQILGSAGLDHVVVDAEHGAFDIGAIAVTIAAAPASLQVYVRVPTEDRTLPLRVLDAGAAGIVAPMVSCAADAERLVRTTKYPPLGARGISTFRAHTGFVRADVRVQLAAANDRVRAMAQIETVAALDALAPISAVPGLDALVLGPNDLLADAGSPGRFDDPILVRAVDQIAEAAHAHGLTAGVMSSDRALVRRALARGFDWVTWSSDAALLHGAAAAARHDVLEDLT